MPRLVTTASTVSCSLLVSFLTACVLCACGRDTEFVTVLPEEELPAPDAEGEESPAEPDEEVGEEPEPEEEEPEEEEEEDGIGDDEGNPDEDQDGDEEDACDTSFQTAAVTEVGGLLTADTVWTLVGSPYEVTSTVLVPPGVRLTILPGVEVRSAVADDLPILFVVSGMVDAQGTVDAPIVFDGRCEAAFFSGPEGSSVAGRVTVSHAVLQNARSFWPAPGGQASFSLSDSRLENLSEASFVLYPEADVLIERNVFVRAAGFSIGHSEANVFVRGNRFVSFHPLIDGAAGEFDSAFWVENWAAYFGTQTIVEQNAFLTTGQTAVQLPVEYADAALTVRSNFWGTTDDSVISTMVFDAADGLSAGLIDVSPVLTEIPLSVPGE